MSPDMVILPLNRYKVDNESIVLDMSSDTENKKWYSHIPILFQGTLRRSSICLIIIWFSLSFGYYGLTLWMPEFFSNSNSVFNPYESVFISSLANIPGNIISIFSVDIVGRRMTLGMSMIISGISVFFIFLIDNGISVIIMSCVFSGLSIPAWNALDILSTELFPTNIRATAMGFIMIVGRLGAIFGNVIFGEFITLSSAIPLCTSAAFLILGGITGFFLPNSVGIDLVDSW